MTTVVTVRSYSRNSGDTSWEHVTSWPWARNAAATACSWAGSRSAWSRHTATAAASAGMAGRRVEVDLALRASVGTQPAATSKRRSRGTSGSGRTTEVS